MLCQTFAQHTGHACSVALCWITARLAPVTLQASDVRQQTAAIVLYMHNWGLFKLCFSSNVT